MRARLCDSVSGRYRTDETILLTKHVVAAGKFAKDAGSTPAASSLRSERSDERRLPRRSLLLRRRRAWVYLNERSELRLGKPANGKWNSVTFISSKVNWPQSTFM